VPAKDSRGELFRAAIALLLSFLVFYLVNRSVFLVYARYSLIEKFLAILFLTAESFIMIHAVGFFTQVYRNTRYPVQEIAPDYPLPVKPRVAILIPARHEPREVLEKTLISCYNLRYSEKTIYLLDDSSEERFKIEAEEAARKYDAKIFRREPRHGAKAGIINDCVKGLTEEYVAIFDADQNPMPDFLLKLMPILESDPKLALIQTPQFYSNANYNKVTLGSEMQQAVFYEYICDAKNINGTMICCGTNVVIRRRALIEAGGFDESSVTEDFSTSFTLHTMGWKTRYYNHVKTFGMGPVDLSSYFKQQNRWASGNVGMLRKIIPSFLKSPGALSLSQWFDYFITGSYYLIGWAYLFLVFCPIVYIFFNIPSFFMDTSVYTMTFVPYFILCYVIFYTSMGERRYTPLQIFQGQALLFLTHPVFLRASTLGLLGYRSTFQVTFKGKGHSISYRELWPQIVFWAINLAALTWGVNRMLYDPTSAILVNLLWILYHFILLSSLFYFNEE